MNKKDEELLRDTIQKSLKDTHSKGLLQGSKAMCGVILEKANDTTKTPEERIAEIKRFCEVSLGEKA